MEGRTGSVAGDEFGAVSITDGGDQAARCVVVGAVGMDEIVVADAPEGRGSGALRHAMAVGEEHEDADNPKEEDRAEDKEEEKLFKHTAPWKQPTTWGQRKRRISRNGSASLTRTGTFRELN